MESLKKSEKMPEILMGLPDNTSSSAFLGLLGILAVESVIHKNLLNLFTNMMRVHKETQYVYFR